MFSKKEDDTCAQPRVIYIEPKKIKKIEEATDKLEVTELWIKECLDRFFPKVYPRLEFLSVGNEGVAIYKLKLIPDFVTMDEIKKDPKILLKFQSFILKIWNFRYVEEQLLLSARPELQTRDEKRRFKEAHLSSTELYYEMLREINYLKKFRSTKLVPALLFDFICGARGFVIMQEFGLTMNVSAPVLFPKSKEIMLPYILPAMNTEGLSFDEKMYGLIQGIVSLSKTSSTSNQQGIFQQDVSKLFDSDIDTNIFDNIYFPTQQLTNNETVYRLFNSKEFFVRQKSQFSKVFPYFDVLKVFRGINALSSNGWVHGDLHFNNVVYSSPPTAATTSAAASSAAKLQLSAGQTSASGGIHFIDGGRAGNFVETIPQLIFFDHNLPYLATADDTVVFLRRTYDYMYLFWHLVFFNERYNKIYTAIDVSEFVKRARASAATLSSSAGATATASASSSFTVSASASASSSAPKATLANVLKINESDKIGRLNVNQLMNRVILKATKQYNLFLMRFPICMIFNLVSFNDFIKFINITSDVTKQNEFIALGYLALQQIKMLQHIDSIFQ